MLWTWDTLSTPDPLDYADQQERWEDAIKKEESVKFKFPLKAVDSTLTSVDLDFVEPSIDNPKSDQNKGTIKIIKTGKKNNNKNGLF